MQFYTVLTALILTCFISSCQTTTSDSKPQSQTETEFLKRNEMLFERILRDNGRLPSTGKHCGSVRMKVRKESELNGVEIPVDLYNECVRLLE